MPKFLSLVFYSLICLPVLLIPVLLMIDNKKHLKLVVLLMSLSTIQLLMLLFGGEWTLYTPMQFMGQQIYFSLSKSSFIFSLATLVSAWFFLFFFQKSHLRTRRDALLFCLALSIAFLAFFSGQFMQRYLALEWIGFIIVLLPLRSIHDKNGFRNSADTFLILKIGDLFLLAAILLMYAQTGILDINLVITKITAGGNNFPWIIVCLLLAVFIKMAIYPFGLWLRIAGSRDDGLIYWVPLILMPTLGLYLFYRILPIVQSNPIIQILLLIFVSLFFIFSLFAKRQLIYLSTLLSFFNRFLLVLAVFMPIQLFPYIGVVYILIKTLFICFQPKLLETKSNISQVKPVSNFEVTNAKYSIFNEQFLFDRIKLAGQEFASFINQSIEKKLFTAGLQGFAYLFGKSAIVLHRLENVFINNGIQNFAEFVERFAVWLRDTVENGFERLWQFLGKKMFNYSVSTLNHLEQGGDDFAVNALQKTLNSIEKQDERSVKKPLRLDLLWVPLFMILIILFLLFVERG